MQHLPTSTLKRWLTLDNVPPQVRQEIKQILKERE